MKKDCYGLEFADAEKYRECATCPLLEECTKTVYLRGARGAHAFGQALGLLAGLVLVLLGAVLFPDHPQAAAWIVGAGLLYTVAVLRVAKEYAASSTAQQEDLLRRAEAKG